MLVSRFPTAQGILVNNCVIPCIPGRSSHLIQTCTLASLSSDPNAGDNGSIIRTLAPGSHMTEMEIKKSRFLAYATRADSWQDAHNYVQTIKIEHPKARHWCYGYCGGRGHPVTERCSDDGEPSGTAGSPILSAIRAASLSDTICVVVRYFGGVKLGAGGLIRAYGAAARQTLSQAPVEILHPLVSLRLLVPGGTAVGAVYEVAARVGGSTRDEYYDTDGTVSITLTVESSMEILTRNALRDATRGTVRFLRNNEDD